MPSLFRSLFALLTAAFLAVPSARAEPAQVTVGMYVNNVQELSFVDSRLVIDFYVWFRWKPDGALKGYKPLDSFEIMNGRIENKASVVEKVLGDVNYASARITATIFKQWDMAAFPVDRQRLEIFLEDTGLADSDMVFVRDRTNSRIGNEIALPGWRLGNFDSRVTRKTYLTNYGDTSLPTDARSEYSRAAFTMDLVREDHSVALKMLSTLLIATLVAFVPFGIKPSNVDPRFGLGVGALFAVVASVFVVSSTTPAAGVMTLADKLHAVSIGVIFATLVISALSLRWQEAGFEVRWRRLDRVCLFGLPVLFLALFAGMLLQNMQ